MANNIFTGAVDSFFDKNGNWSLGVAPTQTDGNITMLDATSPNCVVRGFQSCMNFTCTGFTGSLTINSGLFLRCFGTVLTLSGTMTILGSGTLDPSNTMTITTNGTNVPYVNFTYSNFFTFTFADTFNNSTSFRSVVGSAIFNGADLYLGGNVNIASSTGGGTSTFRYTGSSGTWTCVANQSLKNNFTIEAGANLTISGTVYYGTGTLTVDPAAALVTTGSTLNLATCTFNTGLAQFNTINMTACRPLLLNGSDLHCNNIILNSGSEFINKTTSEQVYVSNNFTDNVSVADITFNGTATINFNGTGSIGKVNSTAKSLNFQQPLVINTAGTITFTANGSYISLLTSFQVIAGTVISTNANIVSGNTTWDCSSITIDRLLLPSGTNTCNSLLKVTNCLMTVSTGATIFTGAYGFNFTNLTGDWTSVGSSTTKQIVLKDGNNYVVNSACSLIGKSTLPVILKSSSASSYAYFNLAYGASQNMRYIQATDIDSSGGQTIMAGVNSTLLRTINWQLTEGNWWLVLNRA